MILMSPPINLGGSVEEREDFLRKAEIMEVSTVSVHTPADWTDEEVEGARRFLDEHGIRAGEFSAFNGGRSLGSNHPEEHRAAVEHTRRQLRHARILGSHCVGFALHLGYQTPDVWSEEVWQRCVAGVRDLAVEAEAVGVDIAAHPHIRTPLCSVERHKQLLDAVDSPRLKVLMDPVNLTWPHLVFETTGLINDIFDELGSHIVALHAKDVVMGGAGKDVVHVDEAIPGTGTMDFATLLRRMDALPHDITLHAEHFPYAETLQGQQYIRSVARNIGVTLG